LFVSASSFDWSRALALCPCLDIGLTVLLRDMNAKIVSEGAYSSVTGRYSSRKGYNSNGELICVYAAADNMHIMSTKFKHKRT
jgi:hypothetical protein